METLMPFAKRARFGVTLQSTASAKKEDQLSHGVLMIEPTAFCSNEETKADNTFMAGDSGKDVSQVALAEWRALVEALRDAGIQVKTFAGQGLPDEVFPNNWFSTHGDGRVVVYPMKVASRMAEVRQDVIDYARGSCGCSEPTYDLSKWGKSGVALEGTGSLVLDRPNRIAYAAVSGRTDRNLASLWAAEMGYNVVSFGARDRSDKEIYHTNVLMSVGSNFAVICTEVIPNAEEREAVLDSLRRTGKVVIFITLSQMENFAGNCLQLNGEKGTVFAISAAGWESLDASQQGVLKSCMDRIVAVPVPTIERFGGGSVRCMIAELCKNQVSREIAAQIPSPQRAPPLVSLDSEWGRLQLVIVHEPGLEVDAVMPWTLDNMKVDDTFNRTDLKLQHRAFSSLLRSRGAKVLHVKELLTEISQQGEAAKRELFVSVVGKDIVDQYGLQNMTVDCLFTGKAKRSLEFDILPLVNLFFMRDPVFSVPGGWVVISRPFYPIRQVESKLLKAIFNLHPDLKHVNVYDGLMNEPEVHIEGGDVLVADGHTVLVGISQRTNEKGADALAKFLFEKTPVTRVIKVHIPSQRAFMHLDTLFTFVDKGVVLTMPYFWSRPEVYAEVARRTNALNKVMGSDALQDANAWVSDPPRIEVVRKGEARTTSYAHALSGLTAEGIIDQALFVCGAEGSWPSPEEHVARALTEQWNDAANVFCIAPGVVVAYKWCTRTVAHLQDRGVDVIELDGVELMKGRGGARCMTCPLRRSTANGR